MVSAAAKAAAKKQSAEAKKPVTPREDPVARLERELAEAKAKAKEKAIASIDKAEADLKVAIANRDKWQGFVDERTARVAELKVTAGIEEESTPNAAQSYADALATDED